MLFGILNAIKSFFKFFATPLLRALAASAFIVVILTVAHHSVAYALDSALSTFLILALAFGLYEHVWVRIRALKGKRLGKAVEARR